MRDLPLEELRQVDDAFERRMLFVGALQDALRELGEETVVVGGHAVQTYTLGEYTTGDVDLVVIVKRPVENLLQEWGFVKHDRYFWHEELGIAVDLIGERLGGNWNRTQLIAIGEHTVRLIAPEDLIIDRLNACVHWGLPESCYWARQVYLAERERVDIDYLRKCAAEERVSEALEGIVKEVNDGNEST